MVPEKPGCVTAKAIRRETGRTWIHLPVEGPLDTVVSQCCHGVAVAVAVITAFQLQSLHRRAFPLAVLHLKQSDNCFPSLIPLGLALYLITIKNRSVIHL